MSEVYRYNEDEAEKSKDMMALLIEGLRAVSYARSKPTSLGFSSLDKSRRFNRETGWDVVMEPGIAVSRKATRKPVRHQHGLHELGFISESTVDSGDVGIVIGIDPGVKSCAINCGGKIWKLEDIHTPAFELDPTDPDPLGTCAFVLPDLKAMYAPDLDFYAKLRTGIIEAMGVPARLLEPAKKIGGFGRYYSESFGTLWPGYYSFEET
jgi:hypothetical protein